MAFVWKDNGALESYVDGVLKATSAVISKSVAETNTPIYVGAVSNNSLPFIGIIDEVKLYTKAIDQISTAVGDLSRTKTGALIQKTKKD